MIGMIDQTIYLRYFCAFLILVPGTIIAFFPMHRDIRDRSAFGIISMFLVLTAMITVASMAWTRYMIHVDRFFMIFVPVCFSLYTIMVRKEFIKKVFCFTNAFLMGSFSCLYARFIMANYEQYNDEPVPLLQTSLNALAISVLITLIFLISIRREITKMMFEPQLNYIWKYLTLIPALVSAMIIWINPKDISTVLVGRVQNIALLALLLIPFGSFGLFHLIYTLTMRLQDNAQLERENELLKLEEKRYEQLRLLMDQSRVVRHDMRQHLLAINHYAENNDSKKIAEYISPLIEQVSTSNKHFCANIIIDAVASHYDSIAEQQDTTILWNLNLPRELKFHESDICSIFGNLLENALNAVKLLPEPQREITAAAEMLTDQTLGISIENPFEGKVRFKRDGLPRNTRPGHGIGLSSVAMIAHKYNGSLTLSATGGIFSAGVLLYAPKTDNDENDQDNEV